MYLLYSEDGFGGGNDLTRKGIDEEDIENLIIQQIEFCNIILLNKASEVKRDELERIKQIIRTLQPAAEIVECDYAEVDLNKIINTGLFDFERTATSAGWIRGIEGVLTEEQKREAEERGHHHHHEEHEGDTHHAEHDEHCHHHHEGGEVEEYGISTFVYYRRPAFDIHKEEELMEVMRREPGLLRDWDDKYGDRMQKIVFIGQHLDKEQLVRDLDACLE